MRNSVWAVIVASSLAVGVSAQGQGQQPPPTQPAAQGDQPAAPRAPQTPAGQLTKTTISGCIQNAPPAAASVGAGASTPAAGKFDLANAKIVTGAPVGTSGAATTAVRYRLEGEEKLITPHLNHQVEITGTVSPASGTSATAAPMLKVESVKMVSAMCP